MIGSRYDVEYRVVTPNGAQRWVLVRGAAIFVGSGSTRRAQRLMVPDCTLQDINLQGQQSFPVADKLLSLASPFIFTTGYEVDLVVPQRFRNVAFLAKPFDSGGLVESILEELASGPQKP
ncbi:MAG: hypothetical protein WCZ23_00685 [Rhodospirillaceae bacterium]